MNEVNANHAMRLVLELPSYKGKYVGFFHSGGKTTIRGWWGAQTEAKAAN